jgi:hypothetical protein
MPRKGGRVRQPEALHATHADKAQDGECAVAGPSSPAPRQPGRLLEHTGEVTRVVGPGFRLDRDSHAGGGDRHRVDVSPTLPRQRMPQPPAPRPAAVPARAGRRPQSGPRPDSGERARARCLTEHRAASEHTGPNDPVFITSAGKARSRHNLRKDIVDAVVAHANRLVEERGAQPLPLGITPHKLRHTFASILVAIGKDPTHVMQQLGHADPAFTLRVYSHTMRRGEEERTRLKALVEGHDWSHIGLKRLNRRPHGLSGTPTERQKAPR